MNHKYAWMNHDQTHRRQITQRIVHEFFGECGVDRHRFIGEQQRVAIGGCARADFGTDVRTGTGPVIDHDLLAPCVGEALREQAPGDVLPRAGCVGHDQAHRAFGVVGGLRQRRAEKYTEKYVTICFY